MSGMSDARKARLIGACALVLIGFALMSALLGGGDHANKPTAAGTDENVIVLPARPLRTAQVGDDEAPPPESAKQAEPNKQPAPNRDEPAPREPQPRSEPAPKPKPQPAEPKPVKTGWYVQLGVFGSSANAQALADKAREGDYRCELRTLKQGSNTLHRVLVGPYPSEAAADLRVPKLQRWLGETGRVVELERGR